MNTDRQKPGQVMAESITSTEDYNVAAIDLANKVQAARMNLQREAPKTLPAEKLYPDFNRAGLGVALEYARMGNQAVSDNLEARARELGVRFEHLGLTLGTVLHDIDLRKPMSGEMTVLVRDTLLERKVIFFRGQHLHQDQLVEFGRNGLRQDQVI